MFFINIFYLFENINLSIHQSLRVEIEKKTYKINQFSQWNIPIQSVRNNYKQNTNQDRLGGGAHARPGLLMMCLGYKA